MSNTTKPAKDGKKARNTAGLRRGGGRPKGALNKVTAEVRTLARQHGADAIAVLVKLMNESNSDRTRVAAATELLDRAYGKSPASVDHTTGGDKLPTTGPAIINVTIKEHDDAGH